MCSRVCVSAGVYSNACVCVYMRVCVYIYKYVCENLCVYTLMNDIYAHVYVGEVITF